MRTLLGMFAALAITANADTPLYQRTDVNVPYSGATQNVDLGTKSLSAGSITVSGAVTAGATTLGAVTATSVNASGDMVAVGTFTGSGYGLSNFVVSASSEPQADQSIASLTYIGIATMTATLRGGRPAVLTWNFNIANGTGDGRSHTVLVTVNNSTVGSIPVFSSSGTATATAYGQARIASTTAGVNTFVVNVKSSATGTQTAKTPAVVVVEY